MSIHTIKESEYEKVLSRLDVLHYAINCTDAVSESTGTFAYDVGLAEKGIGLFAISPVFATPDEFYGWAKQHGFLYHCLNRMCCMQRHFPVV